jgi:hypothetical protein
LGSSSPWFLWLSPFLCFTELAGFMTMSSYNCWSCDRKRVCWLKYYVTTVGADEVSGDVMVAGQYHKYS